MGLGTKLRTPITFDLTLTPGIYSAASLSTTAGTALKLDAQHQDNQVWAFNITDILAFGGISTVEIVNAGKNDQVFWNVDSEYASTGDGSTVIGTILARDYTMVGANASVLNSTTACGSVFSQTSYVSAGADAIIGGDGGTDLPDTPKIPEPATYALMLAGLGLIGCAARPRKTEVKVNLPHDQLLIAA